MTNSIESHKKVGSKQEMIGKNQNRPAFVQTIKRFCWNLTQVKEEKVKQFTKGQNLDEFTWINEEKF